jgi:HlyD family secretion protein
MKKYKNKIGSYAAQHKIISAIFLAIVLLGGYYTYKKSTNTASAERYVLGTVERGTIVASVSGTGQVEASSTIDLKAKASGDITYVGVKPGDVVKKGKTLFALDTRNAQKAVRDAQTALETAQLDLEKFTASPDDLDVQALKAANANAERTKVDAAKAVETAHRNLLNSSTVAVSLDTTNNTQPPTINGTYLKDQEGEIHITVMQGGYFHAYSIPGGIVNDTESFTASQSIALGDSGLYIKFTNISASQPEWIITLPNKTVTSYASNLTAYQNALDNQQKTINDADLTIAQNDQKIKDLYNPDALDLRTKQLAVQQKEDALTDAKLALSDYYVFAPFAGKIASVVGKVGDTASGTLGTIITDQKVASITLNEVDVSKIKLGDKATLTFDAIDGLTMTGSVAEIDDVGTVSQGVVSYKVKITFDTENEMVKPGMSVNAAIITNTKQDVITVPTSAVKTIGGMSYVQILNTASSPADATATGIQGVLSAVPPEQIPVEVGLSDDTKTEIISGLAEGQEIVTRTITTTAATAKTTTTPSLFGGARTGASGGGARNATFIGR